MKRLRLIVGALIAVTASTLALTPPASAQPSPSQPHVVLAGVGGLSWADVSPDEMPTLYDLTGEQAAGSVAVRSVYTHNCVVDGWLTVSAGRRAAQERTLPGEDSDRGYCREVPPPLTSGDGASIPDWAELSAQQDEFGYDATLGLLGQTLDDAGACATAVGPGAALALATENGDVARYVTGAVDLTTDDISACPVTVVDFGSVPPDHLDPAARAAAAGAVDAQLNQLQDILPDDTALLVVGVSDFGPTEPVGPDDLATIPNELGLRVGAAAGPQTDGSPYGANWLTSGSTRWDGLVQLTDVTPTLLEYADVDMPTDAVGRPWRAGTPHPATAATTVRELQGADRAAQVFREQSGPFFLFLGLVELAFFGGSIALLGRWLSMAARRRVLTAVHLFALVAASFPVAAFLANLSRWWLADRPGLALWTTLLGIAVVVTAIAAAGPWRRRSYGPTAVVAGITAGVLGVDVLIGSQLQHSSLLGLSPLVAGRFYGFGNISFAIFVIACLVFAAALAQWVLDRGGSRRLATTVVAVIGLAAVVIDGAPFAGADFGGVITTVCGFAILGIVVSGTRHSWRQLVLVGIAAIVVVAAIAFLDWLRPATARTHLGDFVQQVLDGEAWEIVYRKARNSLRTLVGRPPYGWLVPLSYAVIIAMVRRPERMRVPGLVDAFAAWPLLRPLIWTGLLTGVVGFAVNDSGVIVPALMLTIGIPLVVAAVSRALRLLLDAPLPPDPTQQSATPATH